MNFAAAFVNRPVATTLLTVAVVLAGIIAFFQLPVAPLPQVDYPTIQVTAQIPGASPEVMATSVATPLERHLGQIADVTEMTSSSRIGLTSITLQFGLNRRIDGAARDVQAAINAARADLPTNLRRNPTYRKINPAESPVMLLTLTSETRSAGQVYDVATTILEQKLSQVDGIGQVTLGGSSLPAVRVELNPRALFKQGIALADVRAGLVAANARSPKGAIDEGARRFQLYTNDQMRNALDYQNLVIAYRNGAAVRLSDVAEVVDSIENLRNAGIHNGKRAILVILHRQPGANIIETVDRVRALMPVLKASIPEDIDIVVASDRSVTIRTSLREAEHALLLATGLVVVVVFVFLRDPRAALVPTIAVPVSLIGTFGVMYLLGYSLNNLSLMALTIATGFVVDDAIVVLENIQRHIESGMSRLRATLIGAREVSFTVLSMSVSLIAVFIPILLMGGIVGRLFREFAVTLSVAVIVSLLVSLTTTPMICARFLRPRPAGERGRLYRASERWFSGLTWIYDRSLLWALDNPRTIMLAFMTAIGLNIYLFAVISKGFFPQQDTGRMFGTLRGDQSTSFQLMRQKLEQFITILNQDPAMENVVGFTGGYQTNSGFVFMSLKPFAERGVSAEEVIRRLRRALAQVSGATLYIQSYQDIRIGGRQSAAEYQFTIQADSIADIHVWTPKITELLQTSPILTDVNSDQDQKGLEISVAIDWDTAARLGLSARQISDTLYDAFGQRQVTTIYNPLNQYSVVMEVAPEYWQNPDILKDIHVSAQARPLGGTQATGALASAASPAANRRTIDPVDQDVRNQRVNRTGATSRTGPSTGAAISTAAGTMVPLAAFSQFNPGTTPVSISHQGSFVASTISFGLAEGRTLGDAIQAIGDAMNNLGVPATVHGRLQGTAGAFEASVASQPLLILAALVAVYIVLGILYESYVHPLTILSTLPPAGVGAVLALMAAGLEFTIIALIGVILLIGIVKKNAILMIDFALAAERNQGLSPRDAIYQACLLRFRPILMTTLAAMLGALPLAIGVGEGSEFRRPLGISIVGGLLVSQVLTLYTTPVVYLYLDRFRRWAGGHPKALETPVGGPRPA